MGSFFTWKCEGKGVKKKGGLERGVVPDWEFIYM